MNARDLVERVQMAIPNASTRDVLHLAFLLANHSDPDELDDENRFAEQLANTRLQFQAALDQYSAVAHELNSLARIDPRRFEPKQIWSLVRSIKVHRQLLTLYTPDPKSDRAVSS